MVALIGLVEIGKATVGGPIEVTAIHDHAADGGAVASDELCGRVYDDIGAPLKRTAKIGRGEGVVDSQGNMVAAGDLGNLLEGENVDARVSQGLAPDELRVRLDGALEVFRVRRV